MTAFRTGGKLGDPVDEAIEDEGDATKYLVLVNDDDEDDAGEPDGVPDNADQRLRLPPAADADDDIGRLRLEPPSPAPRTGVLTLELSDPSAVRVYRADGRVLRDFAVRLDHPQGDLAALAAGPVELWYEALKPDPSFTFRYAYRADKGDGSVLAADAVAACFAKWMWIGRDGESIAIRTYIDKALLLDIARGLVPAARADSALDSAAYRIRIDGLPSRAMATLTVSSNDVPGEQVSLDVVPSDERTESKDFLVGYDSHATPPEPLTDDERRRVRERLGLIALHESP